MDTSDVKTAVILSQTISINKPLKRNNIVRTSFSLISVFRISLNFVNRSDIRWDMTKLDKLIIVEEIESIITTVHRPFHVFPRY